MERGVGHTQISADGNNYELKKFSHARTRRMSFAVP